MNNWLAYVGILLSIAVVTALNSLSRRRTAAKRRSILGQRPSISDDEIYARYFAQFGLRKDVVLRYWHDAARILKVPPDRLRPSDRFEKELAPDKLIGSLDDPLDELVQYALSTAKRKGKAIDLANVKTVEELIRELGTLDVDGPSTRI